jgi:hypothetical protein
MRFDVLKEVTVKITVLRDGRGDEYQHVGGTFCVHLRRTLFFYPENGDNTILRIVRTELSKYMASHRKR